MALTQDAKDAIAEAIRIVREDRFEKFARERLTNHTTRKDETGNDGKGNAQNDANGSANGQPNVTPPPAKDTSGNAGQDGQNGTDTGKSRSLWWGEIDTD